MDCFKNSCDHSIPDEVPYPTDPAYTVRIQCDVNGKEASAYYLAEDVFCEASIIPKTCKLES